MIQVREVGKRKERKIFARLHEEMYRDVPQAIPELLSDEWDNFNPRKNPAYEFCQVKQWLAWRDGKPVGRVAGIVNRAANEKWGTSRLRFTRLDFVDDPAVSRALLETVEDWGRSQGLTEIHGPIGFCDMDQEGMLVEGFEEEGMLITIHNAPYYPAHMEALGYRKDADWLEFQIRVPEEKMEKMQRLQDRVLQRCRLRLLEPRNKRELRPYVRKAFDLLDLTYQNLYGTVPLTAGLVRKYYQQFMLLIRPSYVKLILDETGELVGLGLAVPSVSRAVKKSRGCLLPWGWLRLFRALYGRNPVLDLYLVGVIPEYQKKGLTAVLLHSMTEEARRRGVRLAETGPELETNTQVQSLWKYYDARQHRRRRCWVKEL